MLPTRLEVRLIRETLLIFLLVGAGNLGGEAAFPEESDATPEPVTVPLPSGYLPAVPPTIQRSPPPRPTAIRPSKVADLARYDRLPLRTLGRYVVNTEHVRVKWSCVNWGGAYSTTHVVGGLEVQPLRTLARRVSELGFNCVRLPYSTQGYFMNPLIDQANIAANPDLWGMRFQDIFDRVVEALTIEGVMVIVNNHMSVSGWCCNVMQDEGFWYVPAYNESQWIASLVGLARRYRGNPLVVAFDLRNEPHDNPKGVVSWGDGNMATDWAAAAERAGNQVLAESPDVLIVVSAICFCIDLRSMMRYQIKLMYPNRVVYEVHNYIFSQYATLLMVNFGISWIHLEHMCTAIAIGLALAAWILYRAWKWLDEPLPPRGVLRMTTGIWLAVTNLVIALVYSFIQLETDTTGACNSYGVAYFMPGKFHFMTISLVCMLIAAWGYYKYARQQQRIRSYPSSYERASSPFGMADQELCTSGDGGVNRMGIGDMERIHSGTSSRLESHDFTTDNDDGNASTDGFILGGMVKSRVRAQRVSAGWESSNVAWQHASEGTPKNLKWGHKWDSGLCCGLQFFLAFIILAAVFGLAACAAALGDSYYYLQWVFDWKWGFALQEGYPYTAPVWMGEFGGDTRGRYWKHLISYMSVRDVDFAYWSLDGLKLTNGIYDKVGNWMPYTTPQWEDETYGLLNSDYQTVRHPWKLLDVQAIMTSPASWTADDYPCDRAVLGNACGG